MFGRSDPLDRLARRVARELGAEGPQVQRLPEDQLLVTRGMVPNPGADGVHKAVAQLPGPGGYQVYVARRTPGHHAALAGTGQRAEPGGAPEPAGAPPRVRPGELAMAWQGTAPDGRVVEIHASCGSPEAVDEVNRILAAVRAVLRV